jgi:hypothetical protein
MAAQIQGDSPQAVAYALLRDIAFLEGKALDDRTTRATKDYVLSTYKECLDVVLSYVRWGPFSS